MSSGAIGLGMQHLGLDKRPVTAVERQVCAAAGQGLLVALYDQLFGRLGLRVAQVLLTEGDFANRARHVNLAATLERLLELGAVPIINENDVVSDDLGTEGRVFEDNDRLAALVAAALGCDLLVLLSDVDGLLTAPPGEPAAERVRVYDESAQVRVGAVSAGGTGGMAAKVSAARLASAAGVHAVIANGHQAGIVASVVRGDDVGTVFPAQSGLSRRRGWIAFASPPRGVLHVDAGAAKALTTQQASLLAPGVREVTGAFQAGDVVSIQHEGVEVARGICGVSSVQAAEALGRRERAKPLVHRDAVVIWKEGA